MPKVDISTSEISARYDPWNYSGESILSVIRVDKDCPPNTRINQKTITYFEALEIGDVDGTTKDRASAIVDTLTREAQAPHNKPINFEDLKIPSGSEQLKDVRVGNRALYSHESFDDYSAAGILSCLRDPTTTSAMQLQMVCEAELIDFEGDDRVALVDYLWSYIIKHRGSDNVEELTAVGSAIRQYVAYLTPDKLATISELLEPGNSAPLPLLLDLVIAKMVCRYFKANPPERLDLYPELSEQLWKLAQDYSIPRFLIRDKHSAVASFAVVATIAMRSKYAEDAWLLTQTSLYRWFNTAVCRDLQELCARWRQTSPQAANWLSDLVSRDVESMQEFHS